VNHVPAQVKSHKFPCPRCEAPLLLKKKRFRVYLTLAGVNAEPSACCYACGQVVRVHRNKEIKQGRINHKVLPWNEPLIKMAYEPPAEEPLGEPEPPLRPPEPSPPPPEPIADEDEEPDLEEEVIEETVTEEPVIEELRERARELGVPGPIAIMKKETLLAKIAEQADKA
jgi:hypothetical protein